MGPTNPEDAKQAQPDWCVTPIIISIPVTILCVSLRALFGDDLTKNAVHGSSDADKAKDAIKMIFGDVPLDSPAEGMELTTLQYCYDITGDEVPVEDADNPPEPAEATGIHLW